MHLSSVSIVNFVGWLNFGKLWTINRSCSSFEIYVDVIYMDKIYRLRLCENKTVFIKHCFSLKYRWQVKGLIFETLNQRGNNYTNNSLNDACFRVSCFPWCGLSIFTDLFIMKELRWLLQNIRNVFNLFDHWSYSIGYSTEWVITENIHLTWQITDVTTKCWSGIIGGQCWDYFVFIAYGFQAGFRVKRIRY